MIRAYLLYTGPDGHSHVTAGHIPDGSLTAATSVMFKETPAHSTLDWHNAPFTQYVITLAGVLSFTTHTGETFLVHPGEVLIATDVRGSGHEWRLVNDEPWRRVYVVFSEGDAVPFVADQTSGA
ncbi:cupin domain-containing protein [Dinghuibacter silviterrae]|uniref:AraC-like protein n=1 Tax=Dinghuibacter silviterrae TaxID=1539049 RepID=A0A4R8DVT1_9BACT|nr:hypothetical protein [Dinghuibacter silviterrae]TDX02038.1 hypothetical protein EDB95_3086 [Dinghuibacter silviterrae]